MAKGKKTGGNDFPPGVSGNPAGRPPVPEDLRIARKLNQCEIERCLNELLYLTKEELKRRYADPGTPAIERMMIQLVRSSMWGGDYRRIDFILGRIVGKVDTKVQAGVTEKVEDGKRPDEMTDEELEAEAQKIAEKIKRGG